MSNKKTSPWAWIPSLYFAQGLPYVAVMTISVIMYKRLGISNTDIALYTSWLYLPWVIKPFWSPFVDLLKTKRWWVVTMQILVGAGLAGVAFTIPTSNFFQITLAVFWLMAFSSATHDIAADGFYMLALDTNKQAMYVGIRSTFYRVATIAGQGLLIIIAGSLESATGLKPLDIQVNAGPEYSASIEIPADSALVNPYALAPTDEFTFDITPSVINIGTGNISADSASMLKRFAIEQNTLNGFIPRESNASMAAGKEASWWSRGVSGPLGQWIKSNFGEEKSLTNVHQLTGSSKLVAVRLTKSPAPGEKMVLNTSFRGGDKSIFLAHGERIEFTSENWTKPAYVLIQVDPKLEDSALANFRGLSGNITFAWSITFFILAGFFIAVALYHKFILPKPESDSAAKDVTPGTIFKEFFETFASFFRKRQVLIAITFMLLFRFAEAQLVKMVTPFLLDPKELGGMGLTTGQVGMVYGTIGILGLTLGGIIGGIVASVGGLKKWLWPMALSISLPSFSFVYLAVVQPESLFIINLCVFIEQFGYGFGFTAYMLFMIYFADGKHKTAHYAICTAFMALGMMLPGMMAGWLQELLGYRNFFYWIMLSYVLTFLVTAFVKVDPSFGRKSVSKG
ncbi:MAG: MFS transporter [Bacteroidetes bacterium GWE2_39_28]|nr:MAG: MFS transporter [Bacteroidetes bacterium GWE2_39_28]OFY14763.1 MAG: MFS transporter [Bacteroidetes bacterium GWF2_39_10]OFZ08810.1 MAG: MFS transporter [Bacteroidetes bacterium RIFOXYB2_FULL_39_7]OFZ10400.1 MAG: MFS transporter [Bacteroidetes bacterium RIFOXYC2_FULL_39_11]HCT93623.1 MFS transporter [Rikenellaceae bacterium]